MRIDVTIHLDKPDEYLQQLETALAAEYPEHTFRVGYSLVPQVLVYGPDPEMLYRDIERFEKTTWDRFFL